MCELCNNEGAELEPYPNAEDELCEWFPDPDEQPAADAEDSLCSEVPVYRVVEYLVEEHLCRRHMLQQRRQMEEAARDFRWYSELSDSEFVPIGQESECEFCDDPFSALLESGSGCGQPARFVRRIRVETLLCRKHASQEGYLSGGHLEKDTLSPFQEPNWKEVAARDLLTYCAWCRSRIDPEKEVFGLQAAVHETVRLPRERMDGFEVPLMEEGRSVPAILSRKGSEAHREGVDLMFMTCSHSCASRLQDALRQQSMLFSAVRFG